MSTTAIAGASLLDRLGVEPDPKLTRGRNTSAGSGSNVRHSPYPRPAKASASDDGPWKHDMFASQNDIPGGTLGARLAVKERPAVSPVQSLSLKKALAAVGGLQKSSEALNIRGASGATVEVRELILGTTPADVEAIFKRCGTVVSTKRVTPANSETESVQVKYKTQAEAEKAINTFHGQPADGRILQVVLINSGVALKSEANGIVSVDGLLDEDSVGSSKLRSDAIVATDSRAQVLTNPFGNSRRGEGRGRGRGRRGRGRGARGMDVD